MIFISTLGTDTAELMKLMPVVQLLKPFTKTLVPSPLASAIDILAPLVGNNNSSAFMVPQTLNVLKSLATDEAKKQLLGMMDFTFLKTLKS